jgi:hypothetical protein
MTNDVKYQISRIITTLSVPVACYALGRMIAPGLAGNISEVRLWVVVSFVAVALGTACFIAMQYYKQRLEEPTGGTTETQIFSAAAAELERQKQMARADHPAAASDGAKKSEPDTPTDRQS